MAADSLAAAGDEDDAAVLSADEMDVVQDDEQDDEQVCGKRRRRDVSCTSTAVDADARREAVLRRQLLAKVATADAEPAPVMVPDVEMRGDAMSDGPDAGAADGFAASASRGSPKKRRTRGKKSSASKHAWRRRNRRRGH